ncbi:MAG: hypothetical protein AAF703_07625 [Cyanobacteria bacterium P01_D01_bin.105]
MGQFAIPLGIAAFEVPYVFMHTVRENDAGRSQQVMGMKNLMRYARYGFLLSCVLSLAYFQEQEISITQKSHSEVISRRRNGREDLTKQELNFLRRSPSFGFRNVLAGSVFLSFLQHFSDVTEKTVKKNLSADFFETIIARDPYYQAYYIFLSSSTSLYSAEPQKAIDIMNRGLTALNPHQPPNSFFVWRYKGVDELLFLGDALAAKRSFEKAADWAEQSEDPNSEYVTVLSRRTANFLESDLNSTDAQISTWSSVLVHAFNDDIRQRALEEIQSLGGAVSINEDGSITVTLPRENASGKEN